MHDEPHDKRHLFSRTHQPDPSRRARGPAKPRSAVTSGKRGFDGIDARSGVGRRYHDLVRAYEKECGGGLSVIGKTLVRQAASLTMQCEALQAAQLNGKTVSTDDLVRMTSEIRRILAAVTNKPGRNNAAMPSLQDYIRERYTADDETESEAL